MFFIELGTEVITEIRYSFRGCATAERATVVRRKGAEGGGIGDRGRGAGGGVDILVSRNNGAMVRKNNNNIC